MTPTFLMYKRFRFYVNSREETRMHVHVQTSEGELKVWLEPEIEIEKNYRVKSSDVREIMRVIMEKDDEFKALWGRHFKK